MNNCEYTGNKPFTCPHCNTELTELVDCRSPQVDYEDSYLYRISKFYAYHYYLCRKCGFDEGRRFFYQKGHHYMERFDYEKFMNYKRCIIGER